MIHQSNPRYIILAILTAGPLLAGTLSATADPAKPPQPVYKMGAGVYSCSEFLPLNAATVVDPAIGASTFFPWAQGYMSGVNLGRFEARKRTRNLAGMPVEDQEQRVITYCVKHKDDLYVNAVIDLYNALPYNADPE